ncbi:hypothetical protein [Absidia glauca]|uniref:Uncharacterized protein n=1 Tax=Absidia glauca TaxID=4829 RepID=A0A168NY75_ABSGL|nr:hypothetical protein [Absidia glauca]
MANRGLKSRVGANYPIRQFPSLEKRRNLVILSGKIVQRLVEPGAPFFGDTGSGFDGDAVLLGEAAGGGDDRSALV